MRAYRKFDARAARQEAEAGNAANAANPANAPAAHEQGANLAALASLAAGDAASTDEHGLQAEENAADIDGGRAAAPRAWAAGVARLDPESPPLDVPPARWRHFIRD